MASNWNSLRRAEEIVENMLRMRIWIRGIKRWDWIASSRGGVPVTRARFRGGRWLLPWKGCLGPLIMMVVKWLVMGAFGLGTGFFGDLQLLIPTDFSLR